MTEERLDEREVDPETPDEDLRLDEREEQLGKPPLRKIDGGGEDDDDTPEPEGSAVNGPPEAA